MKATLRGVQSAPLLDPANPPPSSGRSLGILMALFGAGLFSLKAVVVKLAYLDTEGLAPITMLVLRFGFALPIYLAILVWTLRRLHKPPNPRHLAQAFALGLLGYHLCAWLDFAGLIYITAQLERLILFTYPAFVVVLGGLFFGHTIRLTGLLAILLAYSGIGIVFLGGEIATGLNVPLGVALILGCALLFALFQLLAKGRIDRLGSVLFTCTAMIGASCGVFTHYIIQTYGLGQGNPLSTLGPSLFGLGVILAIFCTVLPSFFTNLAIGRIGPQAVAVLAMIGPLVTIIAAVLVLDEPFSPIDALGTAVTLSGIALYTALEARTKARHKNTNPTPVTK